jgi:hypothetical protein
LELYTRACTFYLFFVPFSLSDGDMTTVRQHDTGTGTVVTVPIYMYIMYMYVVCYSSDGDDGYYSVLGVLFICPLQFQMVT